MFLLVCFRGVFCSSRLFCDPSAKMKTNCCWWVGLFMWAAEKQFNILTYLSAEISRQSIWRSFTHHVCRTRLSSPCHSSFSLTWTPSCCLPHPQNLFCAVLLEIKGKMQNFRSQIKELTKIRGQGSEWAKRIKFVTTSFHYRQNYLRGLLLALD